MDSPAQPDIPVVRLRQNRDKRARSGHPWVFSNEVADDVKSLPRGGTVDVVDHRGAFLGRGYANPNSLICVRLLSRTRTDVDHPSFYAERLRSALGFRQAMFPDRHSLRLVHAEGDGLPGLVIDRYGDYLAVQLTTLGMEHRRAVLEEAIKAVFEPAGAVFRSQGRARSLEGLDDEVSVWFGEPPDHVDIDENGVTFRVPLLAGQKTGHFFDQATNRRFARELCVGRTVLDVYSNTGGWALHALHAGATHAIAVDKSEHCCHAMLDNAELNLFHDKFEAWQGEGRKVLQTLVDENRRFGCVVLDPPAFAKQRKAANSALRGYRDINTLGMTLVEPGGFLFTSSCSYHVEEDRFVAELQAAARKARRRLRLVRRGEQAADHPVRPEIPETRYLKSYAMQVLVEV